jgi:hypothetical protein
MLEIKTIPIPKTDPDPEIKVNNSVENYYKKVLICSLPSRGQGWETPLFKSLKGGCP